QVKADSLTNVSGSQGVELVPEWNVTFAYKRRPGVTMPWIMWGDNASAPGTQSTVVPFNAMRKFGPGASLLTAHVSVIAYSASPVWIKSIYTGTPAQVKAEWDKIEATAKRYPYAEQENQPWTHFPDSEWTKFGNNSNTFIRWLLRFSGLGNQ